MAGSDKMSFLELIPKIIFAIIIPSAIAIKLIEYEAVRKMIFYSGTIWATANIIFLTYAVVRLNGT